MKLLGPALAAFLACSTLAADVPRPTDAARPNILFITVDDMNHDTPGCFGGKVPGLTPNIDRLAREGRRFLRAHVA
jgi:arylsulfatase A-like enzyme